MELVYVTNDTRKLLVVPYMQSLVLVLGATRC